MYTRLMNRILMFLTSFLPCRLIDIGGEPYLERYHVARIFGRTIYLHRFVSCDGERNVHDHPWRSASLILCGGYREELAFKSFLLGRQVMWSAFRWRYALSYSFFSALHIHRIDAVLPMTWTLFVTGRRIKDVYGKERGWYFYQIIGNRPFAIPAESGPKDWHKRAGNRATEYARRAARRIANDNIKSIARAG